MSKSPRDKFSMKAWQEKNKDKLKIYRRNADLKKNYGISLDEYNELLNSQEGVCLICKQPETQKCYITGAPYNLAVDHCHKSGEIRALLCSTCNRTLGMVDDNIDLLLSMVSYLKSFKTKD